MASQAWLVAALWAAPTLGSVAHGSLRHTSISGAALGSSSDSAAESQRRAMGEGRVGFHEDTGDLDDNPRCSCDCCDTVNRRPDEVVNGAKVKCVPSAEHSVETCGAVCAVGDDDMLLSTAEDGILDYQRFCFLECKPANGIFSPVKTQCIDLDDGDRKVTLDATGNARDPAYIYARPIKGRDGTVHLVRPSLGLVAQNKSISKRGKPFPTWDDPEGSTPKSALESAGKGGELAKKEGTDARAEAAQIRTLEATKAEELNKRLRAKAKQRKEDEAAVHFTSEGAAALDGGDLEPARILDTVSLASQSAIDPYAAVGDIRNAAAMSSIAAAKAAKEAEEAFEAFETARQQNWEVALDVDKQEVLKIKADTMANAYTTPKPTWLMKAQGAAAEASLPYIMDMLAAQDSIKQSMGAAKKAAGKAMASQKEANDLARKANAANVAGDKPAADELIMQARQLAQEAQDLAKQAKGMYSSAEATRKTIPQYEYNAQFAVGIAVGKIKTTKD